MAHYKLNNLNRDFVLENFVLIAH